MNDVFVWENYVNSVNAIFCEWRQAQSGGEIYEEGERVYEGVFSAGVNSFLEKGASRETSQRVKVAFLMENDAVVGPGEAMCVYVQVNKTGKLFCKVEDNLGVAVHEMAENNV